MSQGLGSSPWALAQRNVATAAYNNAPCDSSGCCQKNVDCSPQSW